MENSELTIKEGYKQTDVGIIPEDWEVLSVNELVENGIIEKPLDGNHGNIHPKSSDFVEDGIPFIMANNVCNGKLDLKDCHFIRKEQADKLQKGFSLEGDVLLTHKGSVGNVALVEDIPTDYIMLTPQVTYYRVKNIEKIQNKYIRHYFESSSFQLILENYSGGGTRAYIGITNQRNLPFVLPPLPEQQAIAEVLSDVDALITSLDQIITKKRNIKQGTMQLLLTGKKRLPNFSGDWETRKFINTVSKYIDYRGRTPKKLGMDWGNGEIPALSANNVQQGYINFSKECYFASEKLYKRWMEQGECEKGDVLLTMEAPLGNVAQIPDDKKYILSQRVILIKNIPEISKNFLFYLLSHSNFQNELLINASGSTAQGIQRKKLDEIEIKFPKSIEEQKAIAQILSEMDAEIEALETRRDKYKAVKQGMMQELLTGKTRLVNKN